MAGKKQMQMMCAVAWCRRPTLAKNVCGLHWAQFRKYHRAVDRNEYHQVPKGLQITLVNNEGKIQGKCLIDKSDFERVWPYRWSYSGRYAVTYLNKGKSCLLLHMLILGVKEGFEIDHINRDSLDNRKSNLRHLTHARNISNQKNVEGITYNKRFKNWTAYLVVDGKRHRKEFKKKEDAVMHRLFLEKRYLHGIIYRGSP